MMRGFVKQHGYSNGFSDAYQNSGWNYSLFGYGDYTYQPQNYWGDYSCNDQYQIPYQQQNYVYREDYTSYSNSNSETTPVATQQKPKCSSMLKAKKTGRVFYPNKVHHSRHNSHDNNFKVSRDDLSPLNRSHDSTCNSSTGSTDSGSKNGSGSKLTLNKASSERTKEIVPIKLNFEDEPPCVIPTLVVEVVSNKEKVDYELEKEDVRMLFEKFGPVASVEIHERTNKAVVIMEDPQNGYQAEKSLNFYQIPKANAYLTVKWKFGDLEDLQRATMMQLRLGKQSQSKKVTDNQIIKQANDGRNAQNQEFANEEMRRLVSSQATSPDENDAQQTEDGSSLTISKECTSVSKFTCKYEIPIKNLPGFSVARKIIGHRGRNMKAILEKIKENHFRGPIQDVIKLRLRGQGSGFKEGPNNCESPEPLHLCVSSKYYEKYIEACKLVEKLLKDVYCEYNNYCRWKGRPTKSYKIVKMENNPASFLSNYSNTAQQ